MSGRLLASVAKLLIGCLGATALAACKVEGPVEPEADNLANEIDLHEPPLPVAEPPFGRRRLLLTVARVASAHTLGIDDSDFQRSLDGKLFEVRLRFGCDGPGPARQGHGYSVDPDGQTLRLRAVPKLSAEDPAVRSVASDDVEAAQGFWLPRPWLLDAACPAGKAGAEPAESPDAQITPPGAEAGGGPIRAAQRIGIVHFFTSADSRTRQRMDQPFEAVRKLKAGERVGFNGFNLVLSGRLRARSDGRVILCDGSGLDRPPDCVVSADVDRVWFERPEDKAVLAEWQL